MEKTVVKPIKITDNENNKTYILEFSRKSIVKAEENGFNLADYDKAPMKVFSELFYYSFKMHQPWVKREETDALLDKMGDTDGVLNRLTELYAVPFEALNNGDEKNGQVTVEL